MKTGKTIQEFMKELDRQNREKRDFIAPAAGMRLWDDGNTFEINHPDTGEKEVFGTTEHFRRQTSAALKIPYTYFDMAYRLKPDLLATNVNAWLADKDTSHMVRTMDYGGERKARALLSPRYWRKDNLEVALATFADFAGSDDYEICSSEITESKMYIKILVTKMLAEVVPGDVVQAGLMVSNSEVGLGAVSVQPFVNRLVCSNGMVCSEFSERRHHVGRQVRAVEDSFEVYSDETMEAEDRAFMLRLRDATKAAVEESRFQMVVDKLRESTGARITGKVQKVVELTSKTYGMNDTEQEGILKYLIEGGDLSLYGLSNAVTRTSQDVESYDRATALEGIGWQVATMNPAQWKEINA
ncbi:MAG: DUF945 domain-containing protein [Clostridiaceae bacterium]|nr:DUF945 domain-containing protein [Clostridiaceae bacterium]